MTATRDLAGSNSLADLAARIREEHEAAGAAMKRGLEHAINAGTLLLEAKAQLAHGQWLPWLREHCQVPERTVSHYMRLARHAPEIGNVADLTVREAIEAISPKPKRPSDFPTWFDWANSFDNIDEWAEATCQEPFTDYDLCTHKVGRLTAWKRSVEWKLASVAGAPAEAVMLLELGQEYELPTECALLPNHIHDLTMAVVPYAKGEKAVEIDAKNPLDVAIILKMTAQCLVGLMFREIEAREGLSPEEINDRAQRVMDDLIAALDAACDAMQRIRRNEPVDCEGRRGKTWDNIRELIAMRAEANAEVRS